MEDGTLWTKIVKDLDGEADCCFSYTSLLQVESVLV